jgi:hypothetical protein
MQNLLDHSEIALSKDPSSQHKNMNSQSAAVLSNNQQSIAGMLNYQNGFAGTALSEILQNIDSEAIQEQIRSIQKKGQQAMNAFNETKKLTAGRVFKSGKAWLGPEVLQVAVDNKRKREEQEQAVIQ